MNKKFKVSTNLPKDTKSEVKSEIFSNRIQEDINHKKDKRADKSFTVPLSEYELEMLRAYAEKEDRSMRYVARKLLTQALELKLD